MSAANVIHGDCIEVMRSLPDGSVDAVVTDPPYGLEFMGKEWDGADGFRRSLNPNDAGRDNAFGRTSRTSPEYRTDSAFQEWCEVWTAEALRVLKPGGHLLAFGGTRTWHRLACAVEDAGFEVRDSIAWLYGSGFPKSLDVSKAIDKAAGAEREIVGQRDTAKGNGGTGHDFLTPNSRAALIDVTGPATPDARTWQGWGTALKPAFEPIVVARKPLAGTVAQTVLAHGTGALNVDGCRIGTDSTRRPLGKPLNGGAYGSDRDDRETLPTIGGSDSGRWPANVILDESQAGELDAQTGTLASGKMRPTHTVATREVFGQNANGGYTTMETYGDSGGASRFFYCAKAPKSERVRTDDVAHPTVKPLTLMRWLVRLVTPPGGTVLEPFAGSGTTVEACLLEEFDCIAIEREADYLPLIQQRVERANAADPSLFDEVTA